MEDTRPARTPGQAKETAAPAGFPCGMGDSAMSQENSAHTTACLARPKPWLQQAWDLVGAPLRMTVLPDAISVRCGWTSLEAERLRAVWPQLQGRVLDIGAGTNTLARLYGPTALGVDVHDGGGGAQVVPDTRHLPFPDQAFDTVTFVACLNHIPYREAVLREAWRVLRPGGNLVATMIGRLVGAVGHRIWWYSEEKSRGMVAGETWGLNVAEMVALLEGARFRLRLHERFLYGLNHLYVAEKIG